MIFNILGFNNDDHVKNFTFLMIKDGTWKLSPAYDLTFSYNPSSLWISKHQMTINGKRENITLDDVLSAAKVMRISKRKALNIIDEVKYALNNWSKYAKDLAIDNNVIKGIEKYIIEAEKMME